MTGSSTKLVVSRGILSHTGKPVVVSRTRPGFSYLSWKNQSDKWIAGFKTLNCPFDNIEPAYAQNAQRVWKFSRKDQKN